MQTLLDILNKTTAFFESKGIEDARLNAEQILAHGLGLQRLQIYLNFDRPLSDAELGQLRSMVQQRANRVPLQHILGTVGWRFLELKTDARALIPRSDTEGIVDIAKQLLGSIAKPRILEIGVGSGAISIAIAQEIPHAQITGIDISLDALSLARENAQLNKIDEHKISWLHSDLYESLSDDKFDLIVSNPPYIASHVVDELEPEVRQYDPRIALDGGVDGLDIYRKLCLQSATYLADNGYLLCEIGYDQAEPLRNMTTNQLSFLDCEKDLGGQDRFVWWQKSTP